MKKVYLLILALMLGALACSIPLEQPTVTPVPPTATLSATPTYTPTETQSPAPTPTNIPTATPVGPPMFTSNTAANCRSGPSTDYPILAGVYKDEMVPILGTTTPDRNLWWLVRKGGVTCWISGSLGSTSGLMTNIPTVIAPPVPTPSRTKIDVLFENNTDANICRMDFYVGIDLVTRFSWQKGQFKNDGEDAIVSLPIGEYDLIEAYDCKSKLLVSLTNVVVNKDNDAYSLP